MQVNTSNPVPLNSLAVGDTYLRTDGSLWMVLDPSAFPPPSGQISSVNLATAIRGDDPPTTVVNRQTYVASPA